MNYNKDEINTWIVNRKLSTKEVIEKMSDTLKQYSYLVGVWVWVEFDEKPSKELRQELKELGFHWNSNRSVWQHPCGVPSISSSTDPLDKYGRTKLSEVNNAKHSFL